MINAGKGAIVNISSVAGIRHLGKPQIGYNTAKAALQQFTKTSAALHAKDGIRMNCVLPGLMNTPMVRRMAQKYAGGDYEGYVAKRLSKYLWAIWALQKMWRMPPFIWPLMRLPM